MTDIYPVLVLALLVAALVAGCLSAFYSARSLDVALKLLIVNVFFGGIIAVNLGSGAYSPLFRDPFIVLPLYLGVLTSASGVRALNSIPADIFLALGFLVLVLFLCILNPVHAPFLQVAVGIKVWIFYVPFLVVGLALGRRPDMLLRFFRTILVLGLAACLIGLAQALLIRLFGYAEVMGWFFGSKADQVTQGFTFFEEAGGIYRIPGTFSFCSQYGAFLLLFLTVAMIETNYDERRLFRLIGAGSVFLATLAGVLSGARSEIIVFPAVLAVYAMCGLFSRRLLLLAPAAAIIGSAVIVFSGLDLVEYLSFSSSLADHYGSDFIFEQIEEGLQYGAMGAGVGVSTTPARSAAGLVSDDQGSVLLESYFGKTASELGWLGLAAIGALFATVALRVGLVTLGGVTHDKRILLVPLAIYILDQLVLSFKAAVLDTDPGNIFFWLMLGILITLGRNLAPEPMPEAERA